jgi:transcriptional antiterminator RfaH
MALACLKAAENAETHRLDADEWPHKPGDRGEVLEGPFAGLTGIFQLATGEERAMLLIDILGRQNGIHVPLASIA